MNLLAMWTAGTALAITVGLAPAPHDPMAIDLIVRECSACHGARGISVMPTFPHLAGQQAPYLDAQLRAFRDRSRADPYAQAFMWGMAAQLRDSTIEAIAAYYTAQRPPLGHAVSPAEVAAGRQIYEEGIAAQGVPACQSCHRNDAAGSALIPRLAGQHRQYLEKQLTYYVTGLRASPIMHEVANHLTAHQIIQVAAFLSAR